MRKGKVDKEIINYFKHRIFFDREELFKFYLHYEPDLNKKTFGWRVFDLKKKNIIKSVKRGFYKISDQKNFNPLIDPKMQKIAAYLNKNFLELDYVIWTTKWLNDLALHMTFRNFYIVEVPNELRDIVFEKLKESGISEPFISPDEFTMQKYVIDEMDPIVIKSLITRSPIKRIKKVTTPALEKILVDLYCDQKIFYMYQGYELKEIFRSAMHHYVLNWTKLLNYARRRGREKDIQNYLANNFREQIDGILND